MSHLGRMSGARLPPVPPPPPILTNHVRTHRDDDRGATRRSRSRSRERQRNNRYHSRGRRSNSPSFKRRRDSENKPGSSLSASVIPTQQLPQQQTISIVPTKDIPQIIRRILNADDIRMPRRPNEGKKPIFDRDELRDAITRRIRSGCDDDATGVTPHLEQQVVAIIREPVVSRDLSFPSGLNLHLPSSILETRSISPVPMSSGSGVFRRQQSMSPHSKGIGILTSRSLERIDRELRERDRERGREQDRGRRERDNFSEMQPTSSHRSRMDTRRISRSRSRSMEDRRIERVRRSRSVTPPPMPAEIRRQLEKEFEERDLRSSLSRPPGKSYVPKFHGEHDRRERESNYRGRGSFRGSRRPFRSRGFQARSRGGHYEQRGRSGLWQHDMYEREGQEDSGDHSNKN